MVYDRDVQMFMKRTTVGQLMTANLPGEPNIPPEFELLKAKISEDASNYTLEKINDLRRKFCAEIRLSEIVFHLVAIEDSNSFIVSFLVPSVLVPDIIKSARKIDNSFFQRERVAYSHVGNRWVYHPNLLRFGTRLKERYHHEGE